MTLAAWSGRGTSVVVTDGPVRDWSSRALDDIPVAGISFTAGDSRTQGAEEDEPLVVSDLISRLSNGMTEGALISNLLASVRMRLITVSFSRKISL